MKGICSFVSLLLVVIFFSSFLTNDTFCLKRLKVIGVVDLKEDAGSIFPRKELRAKVVNIVFVFDRVYVLVFCRKNSLNIISAKDYEKCQSDCCTYLPVNKSLIFFSAVRKEWIRSL